MQSITGQVGVRPDRRNGHDRPAVRRVAAAEGEGAAGRRRGDRRRRRRRAADRQGRQGDRLRRRAEPRLQRRSRPTEFNTLTLAEGAWPKAGRGHRRQVDGRQEGLHGRPEDRHPGRGPVEKFRISGIVKFGSVSSIGGATLAGFDLPTAQQLFDKVGQARPDPHCGEGRASRRSSSLRDPHDPAAGHAGATRRRAGRGGRGGHQRVHLVPAEVPPRVRRDRALRRRVRDRQLALDHDRAAHARVRDAADARRLSPPGAVLGGRSSRSSIGTLASVVGLFLGLGAREGPLQALRRRRLHAAEQRPLFSTRTIIVSLLRRDHRDAAREPRPARPATRVPPIAAVREGATLPEGASPGSAPSDRAILTAVGFAGLLADCSRRARHDAGPAVHDPRHVAGLHRCRDALGAARESSCRRSSPVARGRFRFTVRWLLASVLAAAVRRLGPGRRASSRSRRGARPMCSSSASR